MKMKLFTDQGYDLSSFVGKIELCHSQYRDSPEIIAALKQLYCDVLPDDQVIWCSHSPLPRGYTETTRYEHIIDADTRDILKNVNTFVWETCILQRRVIPTQVRIDLMNSCRATEFSERQSELETKIDAYIVEHTPDDPWNHLFSPAEHPEMSSVLLRWPLQYSRIVFTKPYSTQEDEIL